MEMRNARQEQLCVVVFCSVLQRVAACGRKLLEETVCGSVGQCVASGESVLHCVAV